MFRRICGVTFTSFILIGLLTYIIFLGVMQYREHTHLFMDEWRKIAVIENYDHGLVIKWQSECLSMPAWQSIHEEFDILGPGQCTVYKPKDDKCRWCQQKDIEHCGAYLFDYERFDGKYKFGWGPRMTHFDNYVCQCPECRAKNTITQETE